jgi:hypothetical protein
MSRIQISENEKIFLATLGKTQPMKLDLMLPESMAMEEEYKKA